MPIRSPKPAGESPTAIDADTLRKVVWGLLISTPASQELAVRRFLHRDVKYEDHLSKAEGRWTVWKILRAYAGLCDVDLVEQNIVVDKDSLQGIIWVDQRTRPRIPLIQYLLPALPSPTIIHMKFARQPDGTLLVTHLTMTSQAALLMGPLGPWIQANIVQPCGRFALESVAELLSVGVGVMNRLNRVWQGGSGAPLATAANNVG